MQQVLDKKQHDEIRQLHYDYMQVRIRIADLVLQTDAAKDAAKEIRTRMTSFDRSIIKKYGEGTTINLETGEIMTKK